MYTFASIPAALRPALRPLAPSMVHTGTSNQLLQRQLAGRTNKSSAPAMDEREIILRSAEKARTTQDRVARKVHAWTALGYQIRVFAPAFVDHYSGLTFDEKLTGISVDKNKEVRIGEAFLLSIERTNLEVKGQVLLRELQTKIPLANSQQASPPAVPPLPETKPATPTPFEQHDSVAKKEMAALFCATQKTNHEHCGLVVRNDEDGSFFGTGAKTDKSNRRCAVDRELKLKETVVAFYHSHPANQGNSFSEEDFENAKARHWNFYLINAQGQMFRHNWQWHDDPTIAKIVDLGKIDSDCPGK